MFIEITPYKYSHGSSADRLETESPHIINLNFIVKIQAGSFGTYITVQHGKDTFTQYVSERYEELERLLNVFKVIGY